MNRYFWVGGAMLALTGCGPMVYHKQIYLPSGETGYVINCDGDYADWGSCMNEAGKICGPAGYKTIERNYEKGHEGRSSTAEGYKVGYSQTTHGRNMVIACNAAASGNKGK